jgi:histidyl-tRNA synthetase
MKVLDTVRGMRDLLPDDLAKRRKVESVVEELFRLYGYREIETPVLESYSLLSAKAGEEIRHRMYVFKDLGGRQVALRPEMTASVARLVAGKLRSEAKPLRLGYFADCYRYDNPQMGRYREFRQAGFELLGSSRPEADAEILLVACDLLRRLGLRFSVKVGHVGILRGVLQAGGVEEKEQNVILGLLDKHRLRAALKALRALKVPKECLDAVKGLQRVQGSEYEQVLKAGERLVASNGVALAALRNLGAVLRLFSEGGMNGLVLVDLGFTRGLDYYTGMIFELYVPDLEIALGGGGRYDRLVESFGGEATPAVGCSPGVDRIVLAMEKQSLFPEGLGLAGGSVLVISLGDEQSGMGLKLACALRGRGVSVVGDVVLHGVGEALGAASKAGIPLAVIIGPREAEKGVVTLRNLASKTQSEVPFDEAAPAVERML